MVAKNVRRRLQLAAAAMSLAISAPSLGQASAPIDRLGIPGPIDFAGMQFDLAWSAQPAADYIKHEYLLAGQNLENYTDMVSVELLTSGVSLADAVAAQTGMLDDRKGRDPLVNYQQRNNPNDTQIVLDFLMSDERRGVRIIEWNAYRYVSVGMPSGKKAVVLFAISRRHYGGGADDFLTRLKTKRVADIDALIAHSVPGVEPVE